MTNQQRAVMQGALFSEAMDALREALAQPQDPVLITRIAVPESNVRIAQPQGMKECRHCGFLCKPNDNESRKYYPLEQPTVKDSLTVQKQGEWVDLTDDELDSVPNINGHPVGKRQRRKYAYAIIAKFKEKNTPPVVPQGELQLKRKVCPDCDGSGEMETGIGMFPCDSCGGSCVKYSLTVQPQGEPVAWLRKDHTKTMSNEDKLSWIAAGHTDITDEYTIPLYTTAPSDLGEPIAYLFTNIQSGDTEASCDPYWKTSPYWISEPLYTTPPSVEAAIEATKEKLAKECDSNWRGSFGYQIAAAIRSIK